MNAPTTMFRDLLQEIIELVSIGQVFTDIHIEQDAPMMVKTPRKWQAVGIEPVQREEMVPLLTAIDLEWEARICDDAIDRSFLLSQCRLRCNVYHCASREKITIAIRRLPLHPITMEKTGLPQHARSDPRHHSGDRPDRLRQDHDDCSDAGLFQHHPQQPYHHD